MAKLLSLSVCGVLLILVCIHLYWGHGGNWPGHNRQELIDMVFGQGRQFPSVRACYAVAIALTLSAILALVSAGILPAGRLNQFVPWANLLIAMIFIARGIGGYLPMMERGWTAIFVHYNRTIYSPLCAVLGMSYVYFARHKTFH